MLKALVVGTPFALPPDNLPLLVSVLLVPVVAVPLRRHALSLPMTLFLLSALQRPFGVLLLGCRGLEQVLKVWVHCAVAALLWLLLPPYVPQKSSVGLD